MPDLTGSGASSGGVSCVMHGGVGIPSHWGAVDEKDCASHEIGDGAFKRLTHDAASDAGVIADGCRDLSHDCQHRSVIEQNSKVRGNRLDSHPYVDIGGRDRNLKDRIRGFAYIDRRLLHAGAGVSSVGKGHRWIKEW